MTRKADSLLERMKRSPAGYGSQDFKTVLVGHGFKLKEGKKHTVYKHPDHKDLIIMVPRHRTVKPWVAREVVILIEKLAQRKK